MKKLVRLIEIAVILVVIIFVLEKRNQQGHLDPTNTPEPQQTAVVIQETKKPALPTPEPTLDPSVFHDTDSIFLIANKANALPDGYEPSDLVVVKDVASSRTDWKLRKPAYDAYVKMVQAAEKDGVNITCGSAYRSAAYQKELYQSYVNKYGVAQADAISSRPNHSEHQTGLCVDVVQGFGELDGYNFNEKFKETDIGKWMYAHAHEYGFVLRYPQGKEEITGYAFEPWHYRYIGVKDATKMYEISPDYTLEEYFHVKGGKEYPENE